MMHFDIKGQTIINAPANEVWGILAHDFANIGRWATVIPDSKPDLTAFAPEGATVGARVCSNSVPGFGDVREEFLTYDEKGKRFSYRATDGMPSFIESAVNNWSVRSTGPKQSIVEASGEVQMRLIPGLFLAPFMKLQLGRLAAQIREELKYFIEQGQPHPRKLKAQRKQLQRV
jgi:hypothetical protein